MRTKRILSILLSLVLVLGMLPGMSLTASAADTTSTITSPATTGTMTITLTIAAASVKTAPEANTLTYSGSAQTLTTTGEAGVGTLQYQLGESATTEPTGTWITTVPQGTEAKDYYVWYRSRVNDDNISTAGCKTVTIAKASITNATVTLSNTSLVYNGSEQSVTVSSVKLGNTTLTADTDYEVTSGTTGTAKNTYTVTVTGKGNYKDTATAQWSIGLATPTIETIPTASAITYGQKLADSTLTGGVAKLGDTTVAGTFAWKNTETKPAVFDSNATEYDVVFTPTDADNYAAVECKVKLTVNKAAPTVTAPTAKTLTYTGSAQELVNAGSTGDGKLYYGVTTENTAPTDENLNDTSIPTGTDVGTYYVWYKVVGDDNHTDTEPKVLKVEIIEKGETEIKTEVKKDDKSPEIKASNLTKDFAESTLTSEEKADIEDAISNGKDVDVDVYLEINGISDTISETDKDKIKAATTNADNIEYFDISLFKEIIIGGQTLGATSIHNLTTPLKLTMGVPKSFPAVADGYTRTYIVLRLHDGSVTVLPTTLNADGTLSFETDKFSTYALAYTDVKKGETKEPTADTPTTTVDIPTTKVDTPTVNVDTPKAEAKNTDNKITTGDKINIGVIVMLMIDSAMAALYLTLRKKMIK